MMTNHYHLLVETQEPTLSKGMKYLNGSYTHCFNKRHACEQYRDFVANGKGQPSPWESLKNQVYLGSDRFVEDMLCMIRPEQSLCDIPKPQKRAPPRPLEYYESLFDDRKLAMATAYLSGHYTLEEVGRQFRVSYATVSHAVKANEKNVKCKA